MGCACSREVLAPTAHSVIRSPLTLGLPHPVRCAYRFSQPPSAFLLRTPPGTVSAGNAHGVRPSEHFPCNQPRNPLERAYLLAVSPSKFGPASRLSADCRSVAPSHLFRARESTLLSWVSRLSRDFTHITLGPLLTLPLSGLSQRSSLSWLQRPTEA